jgi:hypothetical protein
MGKHAAGLALVATLVMSTLAPAVAAASDDEALDICLSALSDVEVAALSDRVTPPILAQQKRSRWWFWGWLTANTGFVIGATAFAITEDDPAMRDANRWGAAGAAASVLTMLVPPLAGAFAERRLGEREGPADRAYLARALRLVESGASQEHGAKAWWTHTLNGSFALAQGLHVGLRHREAGVAIGNAVLSFAIAEAQAFSSPRGLTRLARALETESAACVALLSSTAPGPSFALRPSLGGLALSVSF